MIAVDSLRAQFTSPDDNISCSVVQYGASQDGGALHTQTFYTNVSFLFNDGVRIVSYHHDQPFLLDVILGSVAVCVTIVGLLICITTIPLKIATDNETDCESDESSKEWSDIVSSDIIGSNGFQDDCEVINDMLSSLSMITNEAVDNAGIESVFYCVEGCFVLHNMDKCTHQQRNSIRSDDSNAHC